LKTHIIHHHVIPLDEQLFLGSIHSLEESLKAPIVENRTNIMITGTRKDKIP
jgi:hypothetical protein